LGRGDPDFDTPAHVVTAARQAMADHRSDFSPPEGLLALREAISARVRRYNQIEVDPETEVVVTNGGQEALFLMVLTAIAEGEGLLVLEPNYNTYNDALRFARGVKIGVRTSVEDNFRVSAAAIEAAITPTARAMLLVSPNNPSAGMIGRKDQEELVALAQEHDLIILADDIYDLFVYDEFAHVSTAATAGAHERTMTLNALSKSFAMTGWRLGGWPGAIDGTGAQVQGGDLGAGFDRRSTCRARRADRARRAGARHTRDVHAMRRRRIALEALDSMGIPYGVPQDGQFVFANISHTGQLA